MRAIDIKKFVVGHRVSIRGAMEAINENWRELALVEDAEGRVVGVITDGDIRRGLLRGLTMDSPVAEVMTRDFKAVGPDVDRAAVLDIMKSLSIRHVPVLNHEGELLGIHFLEELIGASLRPNVAVVMAGGMGTRLRPFTENCPKPMIMVAGRPILERVVLHLVGYGIRKIYLAINYKGKMIEDYFGDGSAFGCTIEYLREDSPLGTGGALSLLPEVPRHPLILMNGDQITQINISKLLDCHSREGKDATVCVRPYQTEIPFGVVQQEGNRLVGITEKPSVHYIINAGIYVLEPCVLPLVPKGEEFPVTTLFDLMLSHGKPVGVHYFEEEWIDVGRHDDLKRANGAI